MTTSQGESTRKLVWEAPSLTVVALTGDVSSAIGTLDDEDFDGFPS